MTKLDAARIIFIELSLTLGFDRTYIDPILSALSEEKLFNIIKWSVRVFEETGELPKMYEFSNRVAGDLFEKARVER